MISYKICNKEGLWCTGGIHPNFNSRGKIWTSKLSLNCFISKYVNSNRLKDIPSDWVIIEYKAVEQRRETMYDYSARYEKRKKMEREYGENITKLIERLEEKDELEKYRYCFIFNFRGSDSQEKYINTKKHLKSLKLQPNVVREAKTSNGLLYTDYCIAFQDREHMVLMKLACLQKPKIFDLVEMKEVDIP